MTNTFTALLVLEPSEMPRLPQTELARLWTHDIFLNPCLDLIKQRKFTLPSVFAGYTMYKRFYFLHATTIEEIMRLTVADVGAWIEVRPLPDDHGMLTQTFVDLSANIPPHPMDEAWTKPQEDFLHLFSLTWKIKHGMSAAGEDSITQRQMREQRNAGRNWVQQALDDLLDDDKYVIQRKEMRGEPVHDRLRRSPREIVPLRRL